MESRSYSKQISGSLFFRKALTADIPQITAILKGAVNWMLAAGKQQWDENYPNAIHVSSDIARGVGFVLEDCGKVGAYGAVVFTGEPAYERIDGRWLSWDGYVVVHRLAVDQEIKRQGLGGHFLEAVEDYARSLGIKSFKIDTNFDNAAMLALLHKCGFTYCGEIAYESGTRKAFEKLI